MKFIYLSILFTMVACGTEPNTDQNQAATTPKAFDATEAEESEEEIITWVWDSTNKIELGYQLDPESFEKGDNSTNILKIRLRKDDKSIDMTKTDTTKSQPKMTCCGYQPKQDLTFTETTAATSIQSLYFHMEGNWDIFVHVKYLSLIHISEPTRPY